MTTSELFGWFWMNNIFGQPIKVNQASARVVVEPIPLKDSMFEKNGFKAKRYSNRNFFEIHRDLPNGTGALDISLFQEASEPTVFYLSINNYDNDTDVTITCKYVHELQKALRFAEINDIADNFVV